MGFVLLLVAFGFVVVCSLVGLRGTGVPLAICLARFLYVATILIVVV